MFKVLAAILLLSVCYSCDGRFSEVVGLRDCFNEQRRLAGALEMYNLEKEYNIVAHLMAGDFKPARLRPVRKVDPKTSTMEPCPASPPFVGRVTDEVWGELVEGGYLQKEEIPDPGHLTTTGRTLCVSNVGYGIVCLVHGSVQEARMHSTDDSVRLLLTGWGIRDAKLLDLAYHKGQCGFCAYHNFPAARCVAGALLLVLLFVSVRGRRSQPPKEA
jgi:hypothetical protein